MLKGEPLRAGAAQDHLCGVHARDPYAVSLDPERWQTDGLLDADGLSPAQAIETPAGGMQSLWMEKIAQPA